MAYISVGDLTTYLFCPRKLYAKRRMGVVLSRSSAQDFGSAAHQLARRGISAEEVVVPQVRSSDSVVDIARRFHVVCNSPHEEVVPQIMLNYFGHYNHEDAPRLHAILHEFIADRARYLHRHMQKAGCEGEELWDALWPKSRLEVTLRSPALELWGRVDRMLVYPGSRCIPVEMKAGRGPRDGGAWSDHQIQLAAYMVMAGSREQCANGFVHYLSSGEKHEVARSEHLDARVARLCDAVRKCLERSEPPQRCNRCEVCTD